MQKSLLSYPIPGRIRFKLHSARFTTCGDFQGISPLNLSKEANISREEASDVLDLIIPSGHSKACRSLSSSTLEVETSAQVLETEQTRRHITTFSKDLDELLDGGISLGNLTEICGAPGTGKTQLCFQISVSAQLREQFGGIDGETLYIDAEGSFSVARLMEIALAAVQHCHSLSRQKSEVLTDITAESFLNGVHYYQCSNYLELIALINLLEFFIESKPKIRLIVIDSMAFHFRYGFDGSFRDRTKIICGLAQSLVEFACKWNIAVVITNEMTTRFEGENKSYMIPALGERWAHACATRLVLLWDRSVRRALLSKSSSKSEESIVYEICQGGIRDVLNRYCGTNFENKTVSRKRTRSESEGI